MIDPFADEYRDVCFAQYSWLRLLAADHNQLFAAGDDDQAIYSWRGSDPAFIRRFTLDFPSATQIRLDGNFRLTSRILDPANAVIAKDTTRLGKTLFTRTAAGDPMEIVRFDDAVAGQAIRCFVTWGGINGPSTTSTLLNSSSPAAAPQPSKYCASTG